MRSRTALVATICVLLALHQWQPAEQIARAQAESDRSRLERAYRANNLGVAYLEQFNYQDAEKFFREALTIDGSLAIARLNLALALLYQGRAAEAAAEAQRAAEAIPKTPQAHYVLGLARRAANQPEEARAAFERVLALDPSDAATKIQLGQIYLQGRRFDEALKILQEAAAIEPHNVTAAYNLALSLMRAGRTDEGRAAMQRFERLRDSAYGVTYSQTYLGQGRYAEAMASTGAEPGLVDAAVPDVRFVDATASMLPAPVDGAAREGGAITLADLDDDGDLDAVEGNGGVRVLRNQDGRFAIDAAALKGVDLSGVTGIVAGDYDNDGRPDLFVLHGGGAALLHQTAAGGFEDVTKTAGLAGTSGMQAATFADLDHDGDLDLFLAGTSMRLLRNNSNGTFTDITADAGFGGAASGAATAVAALDFDNRRDADVLVTGRGRAPAFFRNMRDGTFRELADAGLPPHGDYRALAIGDVNKDGYTDLFFGRETEEGVFAFGGEGRFRTEPAPAGTRGATAAQLVDYDNDGLLDLLTLTPGGARLFRNLGGRWDEVTKAAGLPLLMEKGGATASWAIGDLDNDGDRDVLVRSAGGALQVWRNEGSKEHRALAVRLAGRVSNRSGIGSKVTMRAGSLRQGLDAVASTPAIAPADLVFGLGGRESADVVRVLWPSGILQAETELPVAASPADQRLAVTVTELDRKPSSCPYLFTWNGSRFEFVTDFMGGGEMGAWLAPAMWNSPDPDEYVRIRADQLRAVDGRYELRLTNELEEALFFDRVQLVAVDHPEHVEVFPNEGLRSPPRPPFELAVTRGARPPAAARDEHGHDLLPQLTSIDRQYPDDFGLLPIRGYAEPHELILDLGNAGDDSVLLMTGWTDYAFSNDNVAAHQAGVAMAPPSLQVKDADGRWRTAIPETGFPVGRPQTVVVDLAGTFLSASREVRIVTNMRIYWDQILVAERPDAAARVRRLEPLRADLRWRGLSAEVTPDGREPYAYDYSQVSSAMPWKVMLGRYTRFGDVLPLVGETDDRFVISRPGDEMAVSFEALPEPGPGVQRTFLLYVHGYSKEMNPRSAVPDTVGPLPFRAMSGYPYPGTEHYPRTRLHQEYQEQYNTRVVARPWDALDVVALDALRRQRTGTAAGGGEVGR